MFEFGKNHDIDLTKKRFSGEICAMQFKSIYNNEKTEFIAPQIDKKNSITFKTPF